VEKETPTLLGPLEGADLSHNYLPGFVKMGIQKLILGVGRVTDMQHGDFFSLISLL
jgi:hypothetical protein